MGQGRRVLFMADGGQGGCAEVLYNGFQKVDDPHGRRKKCPPLRAGNQAESLLLSQIWDARTSRVILPLLSGREWIFLVEVMVVGVRGGRQCTEVFQDNLISFSLCLCVVVSSRVAPPSPRAKEVVTLTGYLWSCGSSYGSVVLATNG
jgi:hypothetical protein